MPHGRETMKPLTAPVIGYRGFSWKGGPLLGVGFGSPWPVQKEPQCAKCEIEAFGAASGNQFPVHPLGGVVDEHVAPHTKCRCGIHAYSKAQAITYGSVHALVIGWGKIVVHPDGWRSEKAQIVGLKPEKRLVDWTNLWELFGHSEPSAPPSLDALEIMAEQYGTRIVESWDHALSIAQEMGAEHVPQEMYEEAARNAPKMKPTGGYFVPPLWILSLLAPSKTSQSFWTEELTLSEWPMSGAPPIVRSEKHKPIENYQKKRREQGEQRSKFYAPKPGRS